MNTTNTTSVCYAVAVDLINGRKLALEDLERATGLRDTHKWGSDASRRKRASIQAAFIRLVMQDATLLYQYEQEKA